MSKRSHIKAKISGFVSGIFSKKEEPVQLSHDDCRDVDLETPSLVAGDENDKDEEEKSDEVEVLAAEEAKNASAQPSKNIGNRLSGFVKGILRKEETKSV